MRMKVVGYKHPKKKRRLWWIEGIEPYYVDGEGPYSRLGPYETEAEARDDWRGIKHFHTLADKEQ